MPSGRAEARAAALFARHIDDLEHLAAPGDRERALGETPALGQDEAPRRPQLGAIVVVPDEIAIVVGQLQDKLVLGLGDGGAPGDTFEYGPRTKPGFLGRVCN